MKRLTKEQVLRMHDALICETGGMGGLRMENCIKKDGSFPCIGKMRMNRLFAFYGI